MEPCFTDQERVSVANIHHNSTGRGMLQYVELRRHGTTILRAFIKHTWMLGQPITQISQSIDELLITFCGPISTWKLPRVLCLMILELADIAIVGVRSLRFTLHNSPQSENFYMWNSKRCLKKEARNLLVVKSESRPGGINM